MKKAKKTNDDEDSDEWEFEDSSLPKVLDKVVSMSAWFALKQNKVYLGLDIFWPTDSTTVIVIFLFWHILPIEINWLCSQSSYWGKDLANHTQTMSD